MSGEIKERSIPISPRISFIPWNQQILALTEDGIWLGWTYCARFETDSTRVKCNAFSNERERLGIWGTAFVLAKFRHRSITVRSQENL